MKTETKPRLKESFGELLQLLGALNQEQLNKVPFEGSWTPAQVGDHLLKSYDAIEVLNGNVEETKRPIDEKEKQLADIFLNFEIKMKSPVAILPDTGIINKDKLLEDTKKITDKLIDFEAKNDLTLTCIDAEFPGNGLLTRLEWLFFLDVHTIRHNQQIKAMLDYYLINIHQTFIITKTYLYSNICNDITLLINQRHH